LEDDTEDVIREWKENEKGQQVEKRSVRSNDRATEGTTRK
jgi:hypothetical protein